MKLICLVALGMCFDWTCTHCLDFLCNLKAFISFYLVLRHSSRWVGFTQVMSMCTQNIQHFIWQHASRVTKVCICRKWFHDATWMQHRNKQVGLLRGCRIAIYSSIQVYIGTHSWSSFATFWEKATLILKDVISFGCRSKKIRKVTIRIIVSLVTKNIQCCYRYNLHSTRPNIFKSQFSGV